MVLGLPKSITTTDENYNYVTSLVTKIYNNDSTLVVNESPTAVDNSTATQFDTAVTFSLTDNDLDSDGTIDANTVDLDPVTAGQQTSLAVVGEGEFIADNLGNVTFTPETGFTGDSIINYTVSDNAGDISNSANILVTVAVDTSGRDTLEGTELADTLAGDRGHDILSGGAGADSLTGTNADAVGFEEIDRLMGGAGADMFALGNDLTAFYNDGDLTSQSMGDYALIEDFDATEDTVELFGGMSYYLEASPIGIPEGMAIYLDDDGTVGMSDTDEMIGLIKDSTMAAGTIDETTPGFMMVAQNPGSEI